MVPSDAQQPSFSVTLEAGEADVVTSVAMGIVDSVIGELLRVFRGVAPEHLDVACGASVLLCFLQLHDVLHTQVTLEPLG